MNLSDAQGRLARWRLRFAEFTFKVEYNPGVAHHAADAMSPLPHQAVPADPIEDDIPVYTMSIPCQTLPDGCAITTFPTALEESSPDPIMKIHIVHLDTLFDYQCLDPVARRRANHFRLTHCGTMTFTIFFVIEVPPSRSNFTSPMHSDRTAHAL
jgi:hypothetical protein